MHCDGTCSHLALVRIHQRYTSSMMEAPPEEAQGTVGNEHLYCEVKGSEAYFLKRTYRSGEAHGQAQFHLSIDIIGLIEAVYIPHSLASGKKPTGFIYQIEGTGEAAIVAAKISCQGDGVTQITLGTLRYIKIPRGKTARILMVFDIEGGSGREYKIVVNRINYKLDPSDARYKKIDAAMETSTLKMQ